jgi:hypothetical protein
MNIFFLIRVSILRELTLLDRVALNILSVRGLNGLRRIVSSVPISLLRPRGPI